MFEWSNSKLCDVHYKLIYLLERCCSIGRWSWYLLYYNAYTDLSVVHRILHTHLSPGLTAILPWQTWPQVKASIFSGVVSNTPTGSEVQAHTGAIVILSSQLQTTHIYKPPGPPSLHHTFSPLPTLCLCRTGGTDAILWVLWMSGLLVCARSVWHWRRLGVAVWLLESWGWRPGRVRYNSSQSTSGHTGHCQH